MSMEHGAQSERPGNLGTETLLDSLIVVEVLKEVSGNE